MVRAIQMGADETQDSARPQSRAQCVKCPFKLRSGKDARIENVGRSDDVKLLTPLGCGEQVFLDKRGIAFVMPTLRQKTYRCRRRPDEPMDSIELQEAKKDSPE